MAIAKINHKISPTAESLGARLMILMFHSVEPQTGLYDSLWPHHCDAIFRNLKDEGFCPITAKEAYNFNINKIPLRNGAIWITFDDGWEDNLIYAAPILKKHGFFATVFVETSKIGQTRRATFEQLRVLHDTYGWDIQSHGHVGHQPIEIAPGDMSGQFFENFKWLPDLGRVETIEERNARVLNDLQQSKDTLAEINEVRSFAYPGGGEGVTPEIMAGNHAVLDALKMVGVCVITGIDSIITIKTPEHRMARIGVASETRASEPYSSPLPAVGHTFQSLMRHYDIFAKNAAGNYFYPRFPAYDAFNDRFICGNTTGKIFIMTTDWKVVTPEIQVTPPVGSTAALPAGFICPTIMPNGDVWVCTTTDQRLYKLDKNDLPVPALAEIELVSYLGYPYLIFNDGEFIYVGNNPGKIIKIDTETLEVCEYGNLPVTGVMEQGILSNGRLYTGNWMYKRIDVYDFINKSYIESWTWPGVYKKALYPFYVIDDRNLVCIDSSNYPWSFYTLTKP